MTLWRTPTALALAVALTALTASAAAQQASQQLHPKVALGWFLFENPALSVDQSRSCASCHDPLGSFVDKTKEAKGLFDVPTGRNSSTLYGAGEVPGFPDPAAAAAVGREVHAMGLEERCLAPIGNPQEMGASIPKIIQRLRAEKGMNRRFDATFFGTGGVTKERLGQALAAYVRSITPPRSPYRAWLEGDVEALSPEERAGLDVFRHNGRCAECHSGNAMSDGLMHPVSPDPSAATVAFQRRQEFLAKVVPIAEGRRRGSNGISAHDARQMTAAVSTAPVVYYGPRQTTRHTLPLWDVARTGPYFRDGTVSDLRQAVLVHAERLKTLKASPRQTGAALAQSASAGLPVPEALKPTYTLEDFPAPGELSPMEIDHLMAFLHALSPRIGRGRLGDD